MRIVGIGTRSSLWQPSAAELALLDWDNSFFEWADLSRLIIPPFRDGDLHHYRAVNTIFDNLDWTIMRHPIDLAVTVPPDVSSFNHDLVVEVFRQASNSSHPVIQLIIGRVDDGTYRNSWRDTLWHTINDLRLPRATVLAEWKTALTGYPRLLQRLVETSNQELRPNPATRTSSVWVKLAQGQVTDNLAVHLTGTDRYLAARAIEADVEARHGEPVVCHVHQLDPYPAVAVVARSRIFRPDFGWWKGYWPA